MNLDISSWKEFTVSRILTLINGKGITKEEIEENPGDLCAVQSAEEGNGVLGKISKSYCQKMQYAICEKPCLTVARSGSAGFVSFQEYGCVVGDSAKILLLNDQVASTGIYLFLQTVLTANRFKYAYGRKVTEEKYMNDTIKLPIQHNADGTTLIDEDHQYSDDGYIPDWHFMESYISSLHHKPLTTKIRKASENNLNIANWKFFFLKDICDISMGNKLDYAVMTTENPKVNFVGRSAENEGVMGKVDIIADVVPYKAGCISVALGGSLGSSYVQTEDFYTSQNVSVLEFADDVSIYSKLFITTCIMFESRYKYFPFGRELNTHIKTDFGFVLPVKRDISGEPVIDETHAYSAEGYIPDWEYMEQYVKSLPYSDRIES